MKMNVARMFATAAVFSVANPAFADLVYQNGTQVTGTGLGAVLTVVTVQDNGNNPNKDGIESGCVTYRPANINNPFRTCQMGLLGGDNTGGSAGNNTYRLSAIEGLTSAGELGFVVNINEGAPGNWATMTDLYLSLFNTMTNSQIEFAYTGDDMMLIGTGGVGQSGMHRFVFDADQALAAMNFCSVLSQCVVGGGIQFAQGTTQSTPETVYVGAFRRPPVDVPEPLSLALIGAGLVGMGAARRRGKRAA